MREGNCTHISLPLCSFSTVPVMVQIIPFCYSLEVMTSYVKCNNWFTDTQCLILMRESTRGGCRGEEGNWVLGIQVKRGVLIF